MTIKMTPRRFSGKGADINIKYGIYDRAIGKMLVATTDEGLCYLAMDDNEDGLIVHFESEFPNHVVGRDDMALMREAKIIIDHMEKGAPLDGINIDIEGTAFEAKVWHALMEIGWGETKSYGQLAKELGNPRAARAVGRACGANPLSIIIPCHRMHGHDGSLVKYAWGLERKAALRDIEAQKYGR